MGLVKYVRDKTMDGHHRLLTWLWRTWSVTVSLSVEKGDELLVRDAPF